MGNDGNTFIGRLMAAVGRGRREQGGAAPRPAADANGRILLRPGAGTVRVEMEGVPGGDLPLPAPASTKVPLGDFLAVSPPGGVALGVVELRGTSGLEGFLLSRPVPPAGDVPWLALPEAAYAAVEGAATRLARSGAGLRLSVRDLDEEERDGDAGTAPLGDAGDAPYDGRYDSTDAELSATDEMAALGYVLGRQEVDRQIREGRDLGAPDALTVPPPPPDGPGDGSGRDVVPPGDGTDAEWEPSGAYGR